MNAWLLRGTLMGVLALVFASAAFAQTVIYVDSSGAGTYTTIQAGVAAAGMNDTIRVAKGTYVLSSTLNLSDAGLTMVGVDKDSVFIDATAVTGYGITFGVNRITLEDFTLLGPTGGSGSSDYGIKASHMDTLVVRNVAVVGSARSEIDLNTVDVALLENVTANGSGTAGVGIALSTSTNVTFRNVTTTGNNWGGVGLYDTNGGPTSDIVFEGTTSFSESNSIYIDAEFGQGVTNITLPASFGYAVRNAVFRDSEGISRSEAFTFFQSSEADAIVFALALQTTPYPTNAASYIQAVNVNGGALENYFTVGNGMSIQVAIDSAASGGTVSVAAGTYDEQVIVDKALTLQGVGFPTIIKPSQTTASAFTLFNRASGGAANSAGIIVVNAPGDSVTVHSLSVDGSLVTSLPTGGNGFMGILGRATRMLVDTVMISGIGIANGNGIYVTSLDSVVGVEVCRSTVSGYLKNGITANFSGMTAYVHHNTVTGMGPTTSIAQNGIQIGFGASGTVSNNVVSDNVWTGTYGGTNDPLSDADADGATGVLLYMPGVNAEIASNALSANQFGIWTVAAPDVNIHDNTIVGLAHTGNAYPTGIAIWSADMWTDDFGGSEAATAATLDRNVIYNHDYGIIAHNHTAGEPAPHLTARENALSGDGLFGAWGNVSVDAIHNWWGSTTGPTNATNAGGTGDAVSDSVLFDPWYVDSSVTTLVASQEVVTTQDTTVVGFVGTSLSVSITSTPDSANYLVAYLAGGVNDPPVTDETYPELVSQRAAIIWGIVETGNVTVNLIFDYSGIPGISDPSSLRLIKRAAADSPWVDITAQFTNDVENRRFTASGITSFSEFTIGSSGGSNPLPVQMAAFNAMAQGFIVTLRFTTATEVNSFQFEVKRRVTGSETWVTVGTREGAGTSISPRTYEMVDEVPSPGRYAYRIVQFDRDGQSRDAGTVEVEITLGPTKFALDQNFPNPFNPATVIAFTVPEDGHVTLKIFNVLGEEVAMLVSETLRAGISHRATFDASKLASGIYFAELRFGGQRLLKRMVLLK